MKGENAAAEMQTVPGSRLHEISLEGIEPARIVEVTKGA